MLNLQRTDARRELAQFVRERRSRTKPQDVGLQAGGRRRTPGLRREEVAQLAGVSVTWYTWFEQGRDIQVSTGFLDRVSNALRLDAAERGVLFEMAQHHAPAAAPEPAVVATSWALALTRSDPPPAAPVPGGAVVPMRTTADSETDRINEAIRKVLVNDHARSSVPDPPPEPAAGARPRSGLRLGLALTVLTAFMLLPY